METKTTDTPTAHAAGQVRAWDAPTRLFHWTLVMLIVLAWVSRRWGDAGLVWHMWNGYAILVLIVWRMLWGFVGSSTARFAGFVASPLAAIRYGLDFARRAPRHFLGHNPLGGLAVLLILGLVGAQALLGLVTYDDHDALVGGPLSSRVPDAVWQAASHWHHKLFDAILAVAGLHAFVNIVLYPLWKRENLITPMLTGSKPAGSFEDGREATIVPASRAVVCLVGAIVVVFGGILAAGGRLL